MHRSPPVTDAQVLPSSGVATRPKSGRGLLKHPAAVFILLSLFAIPIMLLHPPLRGADEDKHFVRAYAIGQGEILPNTVDAQGRRGIFVAADIAEDFAFYATRPTVGQDGFDFRDAISEIARRRATRSPIEAGRAPVFVPYEGTEGYTPAAYIPYAAAALVARLSGFDFVTTIGLMRFVGFVATTALAAYAIAILPHLAWAFVLIAMLPAALYGRAIISLDGGVLGLTMVVTAHCLRAVHQGDEGRPWERAIWMTLCILSKPPQMAFALLEVMTRPLKDQARRWRALGLILVPGIALSILWVRAVAGDVGVWRLTKITGIPADQFDPIGKFWSMLAHPSYFPEAILEAWYDADDLWRQLIGILGWLDIPLVAWVYPVLSAALIATWLTPLPLDSGVRMRVVVVAALCAAGYSLAVLLVFYLTYTPIAAPGIWGVQGRYFIVVLPLAALICAAVVRWGPPTWATMALAIAGSVISGGACVDAIVRADW